MTDFLPFAALIALFPAVCPIPLAHVLVALAFLFGALFVGHGGAGMAARSMQAFNERAAAKRTGDDAGV